MKRLLFISLALLFTTSLCFAKKTATSPDEELLNEDELIFTQENLPSSTNEDDLYKSVSFLIGSDLFLNKDKIKILSIDLSLEARERLFQRYQSNAKEAKKTNFFKGYGLGSLEQGNISAFIPHLIFDGIGSFIFYSAVGVASVFFIIDFFTGFRLYEQGHLSEIYMDCGIVGLSGLGVIITSRLLSLIWPSAFKKRFDRTLKEALNLNEATQNISLNPVFIPSKNPMLGLALKIDF